MSGHRPWSEISEKLRTDAERRVRIERREEAIVARLKIGQMRKGCGASQMNPGSRRKSSFLRMDKEADEK